MADSDNMKRPHEGITNVLTGSNIQNNGISVSCFSGYILAWEGGIFSTEKM
jgi:hypothetical protein